MIFTYLLSTEHLLYARHNLFPQWAIALIKHIYIHMGKLFGSSRESLSGAGGCCHLIHRSRGQVRKEEEQGKVQDGFQLKLFSRVIKEVDKVGRWR